MELPVPQNARSIARNVLYGGLTYVGPLALSLVATPVIVKALGVELYGIYALVLGVIGYSFSFGVGRGLTKYIAEYRSSGRADEVAAIISTTVAIGLLTAFFGAVLIVGLADPIVTQLLLIPSANVSVAISAMYIAAAIVFVSIFNQIFAAVLQGVHRFDLYSKLINFSSVLLLAGNLVLALLGFGIRGLLIWNLGTVALSTLIGAVLAKRLLPQFSLHLGVSTDTLKLIGGYSASVVGYQIVTNALLLFERGWTTRVLGSESLAYYVVAATPGIYLQGFVASLVMLLVPLVSERAGRSDDLVDVYLKATRLVLMITAMLGTILFVGSQTFLALWIDAGFAEESFRLLEIHTVTFCILGLLAVTWHMKEGLGVPRFNFIAAAAGLLGSIPAMIFLTEATGTWGIAIGRLLGTLVMLVSIIHFERWAFGRNFVGFWVRTGLVVAACCMFAGFVQAAILRYATVSWPVFVFSCVVSAAAFAVVGWFGGLVSIEEKAQARRMLARALRQ